MKPRTKRQREVMQLKSELVTFYDSLEKWAVDNCLNHFGFATKTRVLCMDCAERFSPSLVHRKRAICPHCHRKLVIRESKDRTFKQLDYFALAEVVGEYQVIRYFRIESWNMDGEPLLTSLDEVLQNWYIDDKRCEVVSKTRSFNWSYEYWSVELEIRSKDNNRQYMSVSKLHPSSKFQKRFSMRGVNKKLTNFDPFWLICNIENPMAETLLKAKQYSLLNHVERGAYIHRYWPSIRICMRNKYIVKDGSSYFDYLQLLESFGKDLHNAHYVCPKNFKKAHDTLVNKRTKLLAKRRKEKEREEAKANEASYKEFIGRFTDIVIEKEDIVIEPLRSVQEFIDEADDLRHCVFASEYFNRESSLILSAKKAGERLETIEYSLDKRKVVQSRGKFNKNTEYHDMIVGLVNSNSNKINECVV